MMKYEPKSPLGHTDIELLMQPFMYDSASDYEPDWNLMDIVSESILQLSTQDQSALQAVFYDRLTYEELAPVLGTKAKSHAWRKTNRAIQNLHKKLQENKTFMKEGYMVTTWNQAAEQALNFINSEAVDNEPQPEILEAISMELAKWVRERIHSDELVFDLFVTAGVEALRIMQKEPAYSTDMMTKVLVGKQHDYGHENIMNFGLTGIAVRLCDKIARAKNLKKHENNTAWNEPLIDTYMDILGYAAIAVMVRNQTFTLELEKK